MTNPVSEHRRKLLDDKGLCFLSVNITKEMKKDLVQHAFMKDKTLTALIIQLLEKELYN